MNKQRLHELLSGTDPDDRRDLSQAYIRPKDASTLIIVDSRKGQPKILMGKRSAQHRFMPNKFVFPGGRVDAGDARLNIKDNLRTPVMRRLREHNRKDMTDTRLKAMAFAAIRETFEETGLILGHAPPTKTTPQKPSKTALKSKNPDWQSFFDHNVIPNIKNLDFIGRAITPPYRTRRFDTRFFIADAEDLFNDPKKLGGTGELLELHWLTLPQALKLALPVITCKVLFDLEERLKTPLPARYKLPAFLYKQVNRTGAFFKL